MPDKLETGNVHEVPLDLRIEVSLKAGKPAFLYFYSDGCHICQQQKPVIDKLEASFSDAISFIRIDGLDTARDSQRFRGNRFSNYGYDIGQSLKRRIYLRAFRWFYRRTTLGASLSSSAMRNG